MKVLIVCSGNYNKISPFVQEQAQALAERGVDIEFFLIKGKGILGYIKNRNALVKKINKYKPTLIHAHYGLSGLFANLQRKVPVITTFHGSDINNNLIFVFSKIAIYLSHYNIFVSDKLAKKANVKKKYSIISCGVDLDIFRVVDKEQALSQLHLSSDRKNVLFSASFLNLNKNYQLAKNAIEHLKNEFFNINLIELKDYNREEVNLLMNAVDCVVVTSFKESGPMVIKEAMAVNKCAVSVDVGDVSEIFGNLDGYFLSSYCPYEFAENLRKAFIYDEEHRFTTGRDRIINLGIDSKTIANKIIEVYEKVIK